MENGRVCRLISSRRATETEKGKVVSAHSATLTFIAFHYRTCTLVLVGSCLLQICLIKSSCPTSNVAGVSWGVRPGRLLLATSPTGKTVRPKGHS